MSAPRPYDLSNREEVERLFHELRGYMRVSIKDGTDTEGRAHAYAALCELNTSSGLAKTLAALALAEGKP